MDLDGGVTRKPLAVSPDVFCTPAVRRYQLGEGREGGIDPAGQLSGGKRLGVAAAAAAGRGGLGHLDTSPPTGGSILAVRDPNVCRGAAGPASAKRVSFKGVPPLSSEGASQPRPARASSAGGDGPALPPVQHPGASGGELAASPGPWTQLMEDMVPEESFTHYLNPLADEEGREAESLEGFAEIQQQSPMSQLSRAVDTATSRGVAFHMQTPEAVQVLHKISLRTKGKLGGVARGSLDRYMRTGPKKLSPEPGMALLAVGTEGEASEGGMAALESSEDENVVDEGAAETSLQKKGLILASPIGRGRLTDLDEVPPTFQPECGLRPSKRVTSPVRFSLLGDSPDSYHAGNADAGDSGDAEDAEDGRGSGSNGRSFSFGMGRGGDAEATAELVDAPREIHQDESVDQPNPFGEMLGKLREDPGQLRSPVLRAIVDADHQGSLDGSPESPANCTPMNLISTSSAASLGGICRESETERPTDPTHADALSESTSLDEWLRRRGIRHLSTPTRADLEKMWDALANIRETTEAYADATRENAKLQEQLWETREAELDARADLEEALEVVRIEQERSRDAACKMAELAMSMHQQFAMLEEERRQLQYDLEQARSLLDVSAGEGAANVMQEIEVLKAELERLRVAEQAELKRSRGALLEEEDGGTDEASLGPAVEVVDAPLDASLDAAPDAESDAETDALSDAAPDAETDSATDVQEFGFPEEGSVAGGGVQCKVDFFEGLQVDAGRVITTRESSGIRDDAISPACPQTGIRAPTTTPVEADDTTTPYRIHVETMDQFRNTWKEPAQISGEIAPEGAGTRGEDLEDAEDSGSDLSDYHVEDIVVSPIDVEDLTRANLRQTVMQRIAAVKSDLASARSRLGHAQSGFRGRGDRAGAAGADRRGGGPATRHEYPGGRASESPDEEALGQESPDEEALSQELPDEEALGQESPDKALGRASLEEEALDAGRVEGGPTPASRPTQTYDSHGIVFARRREATITPLSLRKAAFTPMRRASPNETFRSTARASPRLPPCSSTSSSSTPISSSLPPSYLRGAALVSRPAPRTRRFGGFGREPSAEEDREFRRRAAALNIHVSPYMKRSGRRQMALN